MIDDSDSTKAALLATARQLFADRGFRGTTVRAISAVAGVNLGAVGYHYGSKRDLYDAVVEEVTAPIRLRLGKEISRPGSPLDGIEAHVRATFAFLTENPHVPRLVMQQLVSEEPLPPAARETLQLNLDRTAEMIEAGQADGSIRQGDPRLMALCFVGQPMFLAIYRRALRDAVNLDQDDPTTRQALVDTLAAFVRAALAGPGEAEG